MAKKHSETVAKPPRKPSESTSASAVVPSLPLLPAPIPVQKAGLPARTRLFTDDEWQERRQSIIDELYLMADDAKNALAGLLQAQDERVRRETALDILGFVNIQLRQAAVAGTAGPAPGLLPMETIGAVGKAMSGLAKMLIDEVKSTNPSYEGVELRNVQPLEPGGVPTPPSTGASGLRPELLGAHRHEY